MAIRGNFEPAKSANPARLLSETDQWLSQTAGDIFLRPREKKPAKMLKNLVSDSYPIIVGLRLILLCESDSELQITVRSQKQNSFVQQIETGFLCEIGYGDGARVIVFFLV